MSEDVYDEAARAVDGRSIGVTGSKALRERFVIIDRADLPEVEEVRPGFFRIGDSEYSSAYVALSPDEIEGEGLATVAWAQHLREHPSVNEAQVAAVADALQAEDGNGGGREYHEHFARKLVQRGVRVEVTNG